MAKRFRQVFVLSLAVLFGFAAAVIWMRWQVFFPFTSDDPLEHAYYLAADGQRDSALEIYLDLANNGDARAALRAENLVSGGLYDFEMSNTLSIELLTLAANGGEATAWRLLGDRYLAGRGVMRDLNTALDHYSRAAETGDEKAWYLLAERYALGIEVPKDLNKAREYYMLAAQSGAGAAAFILAAADTLPGPAPHTFRSAHSRLLKSAQGGSVLAQRQLCHLLINPFSISSTYYKWCEASASSEDPLALLLMGKLHEQSCDDELYPHALFYAKVIGVEQNLEMAKDYYERASLLGNQEAKSKLKDWATRGRTNCLYNDDVSITMYGYQVKNLDFSKMMLPPPPGGHRDIEGWTQIRSRSRP